MSTPDLSPLAESLGRIPTGLYLVTTRSESGPLGFVGSFVMQVGFEPPTVCVAVGRDRDHLAAMRSSGRFAISILDGKSSSLMASFFKKYGDGETVFDHVNHRPSPGNCPVFPDALAWIDCAVSGEHDAGDHVVVFGTVTAGERPRMGEPSVHLRKNGLGY